MEGHQHRLAPDLEERLLETLDEMAEVLRSIQSLAARRGFVDDWWSLVQRLIVLRVSLQFGPLDPQFSDNMEALACQYDSFVERMLPAPEAH